MDSQVHHQDDALPKFCDKCGSLFSYGSDSSGKLKLECNSCGNVENSSESNILRVKYVQENASGTQKYAIPRETTKYDQTMYCTSKIPCQNPECTDPIPRILMFNRVHRNRIMYFICTACGTSWHCDKVSSSSSSSDGSPGSS